MAKKKTSLFMTVGTGFGDDGAKRLAHGLFSSIEEIDPDFIVFFGSKDSMLTIEHVSKLAVEELYDDFKEGVEYKFVLLNNIDKVENCFNEMESQIMEYQNDYKIIVDYTSGTKSMSVALGFIAAFYNKKVYSVGGNRQGGLVSSGTETINYQNLYFIYDRLRLKKLKEYFNHNRFDSGIDIISEIVDPEFDKELCINLFNAYSLWDNVNFEDAYDILKDLDTSNPFFESLSQQMKINKNALGNITRSHSQNLKFCYILASLINNAKRRYDEHKYDDAIARLYRSMELIGQISLQGYGLDSSDIDKDILKEKNVSEKFIQGLHEDWDGKIKIGLIPDFELLYELDNKLGKYYKENEKKIRNLTKMRNASILAHGLESQSKDDYEIFEGIVIDLAKRFDKDMNKFLKETSFPKFNL